MKQQVHKLYTGHRAHEAPMEYGVEYKITKDTTATKPVKIVLGKQLKRLEGKLVIGMYVMKQVGTKPMTSPSGCPLLSNDAMANAFLTIPDYDGGSKLFDKSPLAHFAVDWCQGTGQYKQVLIPNFTTCFQDAELWINTSCLTEDEESLMIYFVYHDPKACKQIYCGTDTYMARMEHGNLG